MSSPMDRALDIAGVLLARPCLVGPKCKAHVLTPPRRPRSPQLYCIAESDLYGTRISW